MTQTSITNEWAPATKTEPKNERIETHLHFGDVHDQPSHGGASAHIRAQHLGDDAAVKVHIGDLIESGVVQERRERGIAAAGHKNLHGRLPVRAQAEGVAEEVR